MSLNTDLEDYAMPDRSKPMLPEPHAFLADVTAWMHEDNRLGDDHGELVEVMHAYHVEMNREGF